MNRTKIEWCDYSWGVVTGCLHGCEYCYGRRIAQRFNGTKAWPNGFQPTFHPERLDEPKKLKKPSKIFVGSVADLFGEWTWLWPDREGFLSGSYVIQVVLEVVKQCPQHTFLFLTKNPKRYREFEFPGNAWLGTTVEDQTKADERIPALLEIPAAVRFVSCEPLLGHVDLQKYLEPDEVCCGTGYCDQHGEWSCCGSPILDWSNKLDWIICGSESGPRRRPADIEWIRDLRDQCINAGVPFFLKQMEVNGRLVKMPELDGREWNEMPGVVT